MKKRTPHRRPAPRITHQATRPQDSGPVQRNRLTQLDRVLAMLLADEVCGSVLYRAYIPRFSALIHRLRKAGYVITKRQCDRADHDHEGTGWLCRLEALPFDLKEVDNGF